MAWADLKRDASRNLAGLFWWLADPLVNLLIYYFVFTRVFPTSTPNFLSFLFLNLMVWRWLSVTLMQSSTSIIGSVSLLRQIYLPKALLPLKYLITETSAFLIGLVLVALVLALDGENVGWSLAFLPILFIITIAHIYTLSLVAAIVAPYAPDSTQILNFALRALGIISGIFFDPAVLGSRLERLLYVNPWACLLDSYRAVILRDELPNSVRLAYVVGLSAGFAALGKYLHGRLDRKITKVLR